MNFLTSRLGAFVSPAQQQQQQQRKGGRTPEETIQYLADQVETATLLEDKRAGIQTLKGLCHQYRELVIRIALDPMLKVFVENGPDNPRIAEYVLDSLYYLCSDEEGEDRQRRENSVVSELKSAITRIISDERVVATIYEMLANEEQHSVQFAAINLLALLCGVAPDRIQATVLEQPMHVDRLVDLLSSSQDFIRSKSLEVLITMTRLDKTIQQIVVFKNIFERIFGMIAEQGGVRGNIVVEDCLTLTKNLLADNISNQNLFREMSWIRKLRELVDIDSAMNNANATEDDEYYEWDEQTNRNVCMALEIVRVLLEPGISSTQDNQNEMQRCGLIQPLLQISLEAEIPSLIRAQALLALAGLISGNKRIQDIFQRTLVTATPIDEDGHEPLPGHGKKLIPEPAIVIIIRLAVGPCPANIPPPNYYRIRAAATQLIHSYLRDNNDAKLGLAATIIPPPADIASDSNRYGDESSGQSAGSLIVAAMTGRKDSVEADPLRTWFAASLLSVLLHNNDDCKQLALGYKLKQQANSDGEGVEEDAMPLLDELAYQCSNYSKKLGTQLSNLAQVVVAYLSILAVWLYRHPHTVARFLDEGANYQFLVHIISGSMPAPRLVQGLASFLLGIAYEFDIDPSTNVTRESLYPILRKQASVDQMLLQVQSLHKDPIFSMARTIFLFPNKIVEMDPTEVYFDTTITEILVDHFEVFRRQVVTDPNNPSPLPLQFSQTQMSAAIAVEDGAPPPTASATTTTATQSVASTLSSPMVARAVSPSDHLQGASPSMIYQAEVEALKKKLTTRNAKITKLERTINDLKSQLAVAAIEQQQQHQSEGQPQQYQDSIANLQRELDSTNAKLMDVERRYAESLDQISQLNQRLSEAELHLQTKENEWLSDLQLLEDRLEESEALNRQLQEQLEHTSIPAAATTSTTSHDDAQTVDRLTKQLKELETTQEDLMLLLGDQTEKIDNYRQRLRQLGQTVSDSEDGNDDDDDDDNNNA